MAIAVLIQPDDTGACCDEKVTPCDPCGPVGCAALPTNIEILIEFEMTFPFGGTQTVSGHTPISAVTWSDVGGGSCVAHDTGFD